MAASRHQGHQLHRQQMAVHASSRQPTRERQSRQRTAGSSTTKWPCGGNRSIGSSPSHSDCIGGHALLDFCLVLLRFPASYWLHALSHLSGACTFRRLTATLHRIYSTRVLSDLLHPTRAAQDWSAGWRPAHCFANGEPCSSPPTSHWGRGMHFNSYSYKSHGRTPSSSRRPSR